MSITSVKARIVSIEAELQLLKEELNKGSIEEEGRKGIKSFIELEGVWAKERHLNEEEIKDAEIRVPREL